MIKTTMRLSANLTMLDPAISPISLTSSPNKNSLFPATARIPIFVGHSPLIAPVSWYFEINPGVGIRAETCGALPLSTDWG
ncbi:hypothetical protein [Acinetobacter baumannii]